MKEKLSYRQASDELEEIVGKIEDASIDVDQLSELVKRATYLLDFCKKKLRETDEEVQKQLDKLDEELNGST